MHHSLVLYTFHHRPGLQGREQVRHGDLIPDQGLIIKHIYHVFLGLKLESVEQAVAGKACTVLLEDLGLHIIDKQHTDLVRQEHHNIHDHDLKEINQAQKITWPSWETQKLLVNNETADRFIDLLDIRYKELEGGECHEHVDHGHLELVLLIRPILENSVASNL